MATPSPTPAASSSRLSFRQRAIYGIGGVLDQWGAHGVKNTANPILNIVLGINPAAIGTLMALSRLWDGITDPLMGSISDNHKSPWGRRRPFILLGALLASLFFVSIWWIPTSIGPTAQVVWLTTTVLLFYTAYTIYSVPFIALGMELEPGYHGKTRLFATRTVFTVGTSLIVSWVFPLTQVGWFGTPEQSVRWLAVLIALIMITCGLVPALFSRSATTISSLPAKTEAPKISLREGLGTALTNRSFRILMIGVCGSLLGYNLVNALGWYVNIYYVFGGDTKAASIVGGWSATVYSLAVLVSAPALTWLAGRFGKGPVLFGCIMLGAISSALKWWLYTPEFPYGQLIVQALFAPPTAGIALLGYAMLADICEAERAQSNRRLEATFAAVFGWLQKSCLAIGVFGSGWILVFSGFDVELGSEQSSATLQTLRWCFSVIPACAALVAALLVLRYPLTSERMRQIRAKLDRDEADET